MFKVVPDQLKISEGWVRCGHCSDVFDASANLQAGDAASSVAEPPSADADDAPASQAASDVEFASSLNTEFGDGLPLEPDPAELDAEAQALAEHPLDRPFELRRQDLGQAGDDRGPADSVSPARMEGEALPQAKPKARPEPEPEPELHDLAFVRRARRIEFLRLPLVRAGMLLLSIGLGLLLVGQYAVHDRDRLAAREPGLRPLLARLCRLANCSIGPPRQIDAISIDGSSFNKLRGDAYRLNLTLKNQAPIEVAMPALELTLTDGEDQAVVRRVLMPAELGANAGTIAASSEWSGSLALSLADGNASRIAGYRLLAFYP